MPRGGARPGAGRPRKPKAADSVPAEAKAQQRPMFSTAAIEALVSHFRERSDIARSRPRTDDWNPYMIRPDRFGVVAAHIKKHRPAMAMDQNTGLMGQNAIACQAWQAGGLIGNAVSEGLLFLGYPYLSELAQRPEFRLIAEIRAEEMVRKWTQHRGTEDKSTKGENSNSNRNKDDEDRDDERETNGEKPRTDARNKEIETKIKELKDFEEELQVKAWFKAAAAQNDFFGISHLLLDLEGRDLDNPADPGLKINIGNGRDKRTESLFKGKTKFLKGLRTIEPVWVYPMAYNAINPMLPSWYDPQNWYVMGTEVHRSQLLQFIAHPVSDILKPAYLFGGISMTQMAQPYVDIWLRTRESVGQIIHAFSVMVLATNLATTTMPGGSGGMNGDVLARATLFNLFRDNMGLFVLDKNTEDFKNVSAPISGLSDLQAQSQEHMCSVARIPIVKFTGVQPMGLNATSEGELRAFEETVAGMQEHLFRVRLTQIYDLMQYSLWGERDPDITFDFLPLREETPKEKGEIRKLEAETDQIRIDSGVVSQEEARAKLSRDTESGYDSIDPDDVPDLLEEEEAGLIPEGAGRGIEAELEQGQQPAVKPKPKPKPNGKGADDAPSLSQAEADYVKPWANGDTQCRMCSMYQAPDSCSLVKGDISPRGHCKHFEAKGARDDAPAPGQTRRNALITGGGHDRRPFSGATDEPNFEEAKHPRDNDGKFAKTAGAGAHSKTGEMTKEKFVTEAGNAITNPPKGGSHYRTHIANLIKHAHKYGASAHHIDMLQKQLIDSWGITYASMVKAGKTAEAEAIKNKVYKLGGKLQAEFTKAVKAETPPPPPPPPKPSVFPPPTSAELEKAKGTAPLKLQYLGVSEAPSTPAILAEIQKFNDVYAGQPLTDPAALAKKVHAFKALQTKVAAMAGAEQAKALAAQQEANAKAAAALAKEVAEAKAKNKEVMDALGVTEAEAAGFNALVDMMGTSKKDLIEQFKGYQKQASQHGYNITGFQYALVRNYINGGYGAINAALREGELSQSQHVYAALVSDALDKMPKYTGEVVRGTHLSPQEIAKYKPGKVISEKSFTSTGIGFKFSGNVSYKIKAIGKRGADFSKGANTGEKEVLFKPNTNFLVHKVEAKGGTTYIEMEEVQSYG